MVKQVILLVFSSLLLFNSVVFANREIIITNIGDCTLGTDENFGYEGTLPAVIDQNNGDLAYIFKGVLPITAADDITIANLEGTFTTSALRYPKTFAFKGPPDYGKILKLGSIEAVSLANNHTFDYYQAGFDDTVDVLNQENIKWFGEGHFVIYNVKDVRVGLLGYAFDVDTEQLAKDIALVKAMTDIVIVNFHWGIEGSYYPETSQINLAHFAIDNGADLIIGHHPHVLQGLELYNNQLIAYSLGNFAFGGNMNPRDKRTMLLQAKYSFDLAGEKTATFTVIPARISSVDWINDYQPAILSGADREEFLTWIYGLSTNVVLTDGAISF